MKHLGLLLCFDHYPAVRADLSGIDRQFLECLRAEGHEIGSVSTVDLAGGVPPILPLCDLWVISGAPPCLHAGRENLLDQIRKLAAHAPVYGLNHGEHVLHAALCPDATAPNTPRLPRTVRNPFWSFWRRDRIFCHHAGRIEALPRCGSDLRAAA